MRACDYLQYGVPTSRRHAIVLYIRAVLYVWEHKGVTVSATTVFVPLMLRRSWDYKPKAGEGSHMEMQTMTKDNIYTGQHTAAQSSYDYSCSLSSEKMIAR